MSENLITQQELEDFAPDLDLSQFSAATISGMISRASKRIQEYCNVKGFFKVSVESERDRALINPQGELIISFRRRPVVAADVSSIRLVQVDVEQELELLNGSASPIFFIPDPGTYLIYPSNFLIAHGKGLISLESADLFYEIDYTGGYATDIADIPVDLKEATTLMVRSLVNKRLNATGANSFSQGAVSMSFGSGKDSMDKNVAEAKAILDQGSYVRRVI
jgi:hypothetical protein